MGVIDDVISGIKQLRNVSEKLHDAALRDAIADLTMNAADLKMELAELSSQNLQVRDQIDQLSKKADIRSKLEKRDNHYYLTQPIEGYDDGPFCLTCMDSEGLLISLSYNPRSMHHWCNRCRQQRSWK